MTLIAFGINHTTAPIALREAVAFPPEKMEAALAHIQKVTTVEEAAILSTCNRTEIYVEMTAVDIAGLLAWLAVFQKQEPDALASCYYAYEGNEAARHMMKVACGLDSLVLGEPQILGQMKSAYATATEFGAIGSSLHGAFHKIFSIAKRVRSETAIGENPVSVAYAAVSLAQQIFSDLKNDTALLIGAGETIELVARHLKEQGLHQIIVANRTLSNAARVAEEFQGKAILLADIPEYLSKADIVISSTASQLPILGKGAVESALKQRRHKPIFMVDIAVPRDIESQVGDLSDVYLYTVDDLKEVIDENVRSREQAAEIASEIISEGVQHYENALRSLDAVAAIKGFRQTVEEMRDMEVTKALKSLQNGAPPEEVLTMLARNLSNKWMHKPTHRLKQASLDGDNDLLFAMQELFDLPKNVSDDSGDANNTKA